MKANHNINGYKNRTRILATDGTHMTAYGNQLYANTIASFLSQKGFDFKTTDNTAASNGYAFINQHEKLLTGY